MTNFVSHAEKVKVAPSLMLRAIAAAKRRNVRIDAGKIVDRLRCDFLPECHIAPTEIRDRRLGSPIHDRNAFARARPGMVMKDTSVVFT